MDTFLMIVIAILVSSAGQLFLKQGMARVGPLEAQSLLGVATLAWRVFSTPLVILGLVCYGVGTLVWLVVLSRLDLSFAYPMLALSYVLVPLMAQVCLGEKIPIARWAGIGIIVIGVGIVAKSG